MNTTRRIGLSLVLAFAALGTAPLCAQDVNVEIAENLIGQMFAPPGQVRDSVRIAATLRSTRDPALLPLFEKLAASKDADTQVVGMLSTTIITKDPARLDMDKFLAQGDPRQLNAALATLIDLNAISNEQLAALVKKGKDPVARVMAVSELQRRKAPAAVMPDRSVLKALLNDTKEEVRFYAAITLLETKDDADNGEALAALNGLTAAHDLRTAPVQALMAVRVRKDKVTLALPWIETLARDEKLNDGLQRTALSTLLALGHPAGPAILADQIARQKDTIQQLELAMIATEYAGQLKASHIAGLESSKSSLVRSVAALARQAIDGTDITAPLLKLIQEGHPIVLNWALVAADSPAWKARKIAVRSAIIEQSTIVDEQRRTDFERAAMAAQKLADDKTPEGRAALAKELQSDQQAIVEAVLAGLARSDQRDLSELVAPFWERFSRKQTVAFYNAANYAAIIMAREGRKEPRDWLAGMIQGGTLSSVQDVGFRVLAGWYYAKITGASDAMVQHLVAMPPKAAKN